MTMRVKIDEENNAHEKALELQEIIKNSRFEKKIRTIAEFLCDNGYKGYRYKLGVPILVTGDANSLINQYVSLFKKEMSKTYCVENRMPRMLYEEKWWSCFDAEDFRDEGKLQKIMRELNHEEEFTFGSSNYAPSDSQESEFIKHYIIFWNLFLAAMDDDIYNEQLATVAELAACFGFDEPMMRDWCRAVEYVFAGNKLSEDCNLECETVEGARFFLHKEE